MKSATTASIKLTLNTNSYIFSIIREMLTCIVCFSITHIYLQIRLYIYPYTMLLALGQILKGNSNI